VVAVRGDEPPVIVELKRTFGMGLVLQGVNRLSLSDAVYLAVGTWPRNMRDVRKALPAAGLRPDDRETRRASTSCSTPRPTSRARTGAGSVRLLGEHQRRVGDPNRGGSTTKVPLMTAYRQQALRCASLLAKHGPMKWRRSRLQADAPKAGVILLQDVYGWFERIERGTYGLTPQGRAGLEQFGWKVG
jgi:hypothetical protein